MKLRVNTGAMARILFVMGLAGVFCALSPSLSALAQTSTPDASPTPTPNLSVEERAARQVWRSNLIRKPTPRQGCFHLTYPNTEWEEVPCRIAPNVPYPMKDRLRMETGGGQTFVAHSAAGAISEAVGQFPGSASLGISETGARGDNDFSLQLNANQFTTAACTPPRTTAKSDDCQGWQQFIYSNYAHGAYIQYWLIGYFDNRATCSAASDVGEGGCCPAGWTTFKSTAAVQGSPGCYRNSAMTSPATPQITLTGEALLDMNLLGRVAANSDSVVMSTFDIAQDMYAGSGLGDPLGLTGAWNAAEFNVFGDGNSTEANFSSGTTFNVAIDVGGDATCTTPIHGVTAESNNLTAVTSLAGTTCCAWKATPTYGGIQFTQSNADGAQSICQAADSCIQPGAACSAGGVGCCAIGGQHVCTNGRCVLVPPVLTCNGTRRPTQACSSGWSCCDSSWVCGHCQ
jgi:hypothetical protein